MNKLLRQRYYLRQNLILLIGVFLCSYFVYHTVQGQRSLPCLQTLRGEIEALKVEQAAVEAERAALEERVVMLRPGSINKDLLEERARYVLGYRHPNEVAVVGGASF